MMKISDLYTLIDFKNLSGFIEFIRYRISMYKTGQVVDKSFYGVRLGGTNDAMACCAIGMAFLIGSAQTVGINNWWMILMQLVFATGGVYWIVGRYLEDFSKTKFIQSSVNYKSSNVKILNSDILLGYCADSALSVGVDYDTLCHNMGVIGKTGGGKTVLAKNIISQHIMNGGGLAFIAGKVDYKDPDDIYRLAVHAGRKNDFLIINPDDPSRSNTYNPLMTGSADEIADRIMALIPSTENDAASDFYKQEGKQALEILAKVLKVGKIAFTAGDISVLLSSPVALLDLAERVKKKSGRMAENDLNQFRLYLDKLRRYDRDAKMNVISTDRIREVLGGIQGRMFSFGSGNFGEITGSYIPDIDMMDVVINNKILYVALPTLGKDLTALNFGKLVTGDLKSTFAKIYKLPEEQRPNPPFLLICDEPSGYITDSWGRVAEQVRAARTPFIPLTQTNASYEAVSKELFEMVFTNLSTKISFQVGSNDSAEHFADYLGSKKGILRGLTEGQMNNQSSAMLRHAPQSNVGDSSSMGMSEREEQQYKVEPDQLKKLDVGECIVSINSNANIYNLKVPQIRLDDEFKMMIPRYEVNRFRRHRNIYLDGDVWEGANYHKNISKYLDASNLNQEK